MSITEFSVEQHEVMRQEIERAVAAARAEFHPHTYISNSTVTLVQGSLPQAEAQAPTPAAEPTAGQIILRKLIELGPPVSVIVFAYTMTTRLRQHEKKYEHDNWGSRSKITVMNQMAKKYLELLNVSKGDTSVERVRDAAADLANYALIISDRSGALGDVVNNG